MTQIKKETSFIELMLLLPLLISLCMWLGVGVDYLVNNIYLFFSQNTVFKDLFDLVCTLYEYNENNPFMSLSDTKLKIVSTMIVALLMPYNLVVMIIYSLSKKGGNLK